MKENFHLKLKADVLIKEAPYLIVQKTNKKEKYRLIDYYGIEPFKAILENIHDGSRIENISLENVINAIKNNEMIILD